MYYFCPRCVAIAVVLFFPYSDSTVILQNVIAALKDVKDWSSLGVWLDVPKSRRDAMTGIESMLEKWLQNHPAPSWKLAAWALHRNLWGPTC